MTINVKVAQTQDGARKSAAITTGKIVNAVMTRVLSTIQDWGRYIQATLTLVGCLDSANWSLVRPNRRSRVR